MKIFDGIASVVFLAVLGIVLVPGSSLAALDSAERVSLVSVPVAHEVHLRELVDLDVDFASDRPRSGGHEAVFVTERQRAHLEALGYPTATLLEDVQEHFDTTINAAGDLGAYHTYDEMVAELHQIAAEHPDITRLENLGPSYCTRFGYEEDRYIWALKVSDEPEVEDPDEPEVLFIGNTHARELITVEIPLFLINELVDGYGIDSDITRRVDERQIWFVPMLNPDGHIIVEGPNSMWRKNRNRNDSRFGFNWGVDLNRNFSYQWGADNVGSSPIKAMETYRGTGPISEPEIEALDAFVRDHRFIFSTSYHSYGDLFLYTWSWKRLDTPDHALLEALGVEATRYNNYADGNPLDGVIYIANGEFDDYMYGERSDGKWKTYAFTPEVGGSFWPNESQIPALIDENRHAAELMMDLADQPWRILGFDLAVDGVPETVNRGDRLDIDVVVSNLKQTTESLELWASVDRNGVAIRDPFVGPVAISLTPGESKTLSLAVTVPDGAPAADFEFIVEIGGAPDAHVGQVIRPVRVLP